MNNGTNGTAASNVRRNVAILAGVLILIIAGSTFMSLRPRRIRIEVIKPVRQDILSTITTNGKLEPTRNFEAHSPGPMTIKRLLVHEGDRVTEGQLLLELDDSNARAELARATAQLRTAQAQAAALQAGGSQEEVLTRQAELVKARSEYDAANRNLQALTRLVARGAASQEEIIAARERVQRAQAQMELLQHKGTQRFSKQDLERVEAEVANAQAEVAAAQDVIARANIRAPFTGTVYALPVRPGAFVNTGDLLLQAAQLQHMQARAFVDEPEVGRLRMGQPVKLTWDALPGRVWNGKITALPTNIVARGSRMVGEVLCAVDNQDTSLLPNVNVTVVIVTADTANTLTLPREAVHEERNRQLVYVVDGDHLSVRAVQTGVANLTRIEITNGLSENDTVALSSLSPSPLAEGATVKVVQNE